MIPKMLHTHLHVSAAALAGRTNGEAWGLPESSAVSKIGERWTEKSFAPVFEGLNKMLLDLTVGCC
jgi:hypothetical protein